MGHGLSGWVGAQTAAPLINGNPPRSGLRRGGDSRRRVPRSARRIVCPLQVQRHVSFGCLALVPRRSEPLHRGITAGCSSGSRSRQGRGHPTTRSSFEQTQEDSLTDPLTGAAQSPLDGSCTCRGELRAAPRAAQGARVAIIVHGHRRLQGDSTTPTATTSATTRCARRPTRSAGGRCGPLRPVASGTPGDEFIVRGWRTLLARGRPT